MKTASATLTAAGIVQLDLEPRDPAAHDNTATLQVAGSFDAARGTIEGTLDGATWSRLAARRGSTGLPEVHEITLQAEELWHVEVTNLAAVRLNVSNLRGSLSVGIRSGFIPLAK